MSSSRLKQAAVVAVLASVAGACVKQDSPGVAVDRLQSDIVFQAAEAAPLPAAPEVVPNVSPSPVVAPSYATSDVELEFPPEPPRTASIVKPSVPTVSFRAATTCPEAAINEFPDETTPLNVPLSPEVRLPKAGLYRWKKGGEISAPNVGPVAVSGFERRVIQNVQLLQQDQQIEAGGNVVQREGVQFRYEMLQPDLRTGEATVTTYFVKTNGRTQEQDPPVEELGSGAITAGEPERGVVIEKIETLTGTRNTFEPQTGLLLLPLRVRPGEKFRSVAVDPRTGQALSLDAEVRQQERIDACGEILEGWRVNAVIQTSTSQTPITYNYIIAPQFGAVPLYEEVERQSPEGTAKLKFTLGQKDPSPVTPQEQQGEG